MPGFIISENQSGTPGPTPITEAARSHRWEVFVVGGPVVSPGSISAINVINEIRFYAQSVARPTVEFDAITLHHRSNELKLPGKVKTGTCTLSLYERINGTQNVTAAVVRQWWSQWMMNAKNYALNMTNKNIGSVKRAVKISQVDGCGSQMWAYLLAGAFPTKVAPSSLDYTVSDLSSIEITLSIDAFQEGQDL